MTTATAQPSTAAQRFISTARRAGVPRDQLLAFHRVGYVPQPKQMQFHAAARAADHADGPVDIGYGGARAGGKSAAVLAQLAADDCQRQDGLKCLLLRKVGRAAREAFEDLLRRMFPPWVRYYVPTRNILTFPNGSRILIGHFNNESDVDSYLGLEYDAIAIEEATTLTKQKLGDISTVCRTSKPNWRPRTYYTYNPGGVGHAYIKKLLYDPYINRCETTSRFIPATVDDNRFVNEGYRRTLDGLTGWRLKAWRYGDMDIAAGQFFTTWLRDIHVVNEVPPVADEHIVWASFDYGFTHPTSSHLFVEDNDGRIFVLDEHHQAGWVVSRHAAAIKAMWARNGIAPERVWTIHAGDDVFSKKSNGRSIADEYSECGISLRRANTDRINGWGAIIERLGDPVHGVPPTLFFSSRCVKAIEQLPSVEHDPNRPEDVLKIDADDEGNGGDDAADSIRYGTMARARRELLYGFV